MRVKICGITNLEDALAAIAFGADALGFIFVEESPRRVSMAQAREIIEKLPPLVTTVGVFTAGTEKGLADVVDQCGIDLIQFHGPFQEETVRRFANRAIQVLRVKDRASLAITIAPPVRAVLLDTYVKDAAGGTGHVFDWTLAREAHHLGRIILAGGLTPANVQGAIRQVRPYGVDVSSGVEAKKGKKDPVKLKKFISAAKEMEAILEASE